MNTLFQRPKLFVFFVGASALLFFIFQSYQSREIITDSSSIADDACDLNSVDTFAAGASSSEVGKNVVFELKLSDCESGTLKSATFDIIGPVSDRIFNTEPLHQLKYVFSKMGNYQVTVNYGVERTDGSVVQRSLTSMAVVTSLACANSSEDSHLILPEGVRAKTTAKINLSLSSCDAAELSEISWSAEDSVTKPSGAHAIEAHFLCSGPHKVAARIFYRDGRTPRLLEAVLDVGNE